MKYVVYALTQPISIDRVYGKDNLAIWPPDPPVD